jgi:hypothetical protein
MAVDGYDEEHPPIKESTMIKRALAYTLTALGLASTYATLAVAQPQQPSTQKKLDLTPQYNLRPPTAEQDLQRFKKPADPPPSYPRPDAHGEHRLELNKDVSLGGDANRGGVSGNVRVPIAGK